MNQEEKMRFILLLSFCMTLAGCDSALQNDERPETSSSAFQTSIGDSVEVIAGGADVYANAGGAIVDFAPAGSRGVVQKSKNKQGVVWTKVDFTDNFNGDIVQDSRLVVLQDTTTPPPPPPPPPGGIYGAIGCSMTRDLFDPGFKNYSDLNAWTKNGSTGKVLGGYSGGGISQWGAGKNAWWQDYERGLTSFPGTSVIIWQICTKEEDYSRTVESFLPEVNYVASRVKEDLPNATLYVLAQPSYNEGQVCHTIGENGWTFSEGIADLAAANTYAQKLDIELGPLSPAQVKDGCHANTNGIIEQVNQMLGVLN